MVEVGSIHVKVKAILDESAIAKTSRKAAKTVDKEVSRSGLFAGMSKNLEERLMTGMIRGLTYGILRTLTGGTIAKIPTVLVRGLTYGVIRGAVSDLAKQSGFVANILGKETVEVAEKTGRRGRKGVRTVKVPSKTAGGALAAGAGAEGGKGLFAVVGRLAIIAGLLVIIISILKSLGPIVGIFKALFALLQIALYPLAMFFLTLFKPLIVIFFRLFMKLYYVFMPWILKFGNWLMKGLGAVGGAVGEAAKAGWEAVAGFGGWIWEKLVAGWNLLVGFAHWIWGLLVGAWNLLVGFGKWVWDNILVKGFELLVGFGKWIWDKLVKGFEILWGIGQWLWDKIIGGFNVLFEIGKEIGNKIREYVVDPLISIKTKILEFLEGLPVIGGHGWFKKAQYGASFIATKPTPMIVGEAGPEMVNVTPIGGGGGFGAPVVNIHIDRIEKDVDIDDLVNRIQRALYTEHKRAGAW